MSNEEQQIVSMLAQLHKSLGETRPIDVLIADVFHPKNKYLDTIRQYPEGTLRAIIDLIKHSNDLQMENSKLFTKINNLQIVLDDTSKKNSEWQEVYNDLVSKYNDLLDKQKKLLQKSDQNLLTTISSKFENNINELNRKIYNLESENRELNAVKDDLNRRINSLLIELATFRRDKTATYSSTEILVTSVYQDFKNLIEQDFPSISNQIYSGRIKTGTNFDKDRKVEIARIYSILSEKVILKEYQRYVYANKKEKIDEIALLVKAISQKTELSSDITNILHARLLEELCLEVGDVSGEHFDSKEIDSIFNIIGIENSYKNQVAKDMEFFCTKSQKFISQVFKTDPPCELWLENSGTNFDQEKHTAYHFSHEFGKIGMTVFPGFRFGSHVYSKPVVVTN